MKRKKFEPGTMLLVEWEDTTSDSAWKSDTDKEKIVVTPVKTMGCFLFNKKKSIALCHSVTKDGNYDYTVIPYGCVTNIEELEIKSGCNEQS